MAADVTPGLLEAIKNEFQDAVDGSELIRQLLEKIEKGGADYVTVHDYATELGRILSAALQNNLSSAVLPDGRMYYNIAKRIMESTLTNNHHMVANVAAQVQDQLNRTAGFGIKGLKVPPNDDRIKGFIERLSNEPLLDDVKWMLGEPVVNHSQSVVEEVIKANADFHSKSGIKATITRSTTGWCCDWCQKLAGTYDYHEVKDTGNPVFMRHQHCDCLVTYNPGDGRRQNVHTKNWA